MDRKKFTIEDLKNAQRAVESASCRPTFDERDHEIRMGAMAYQAIRIVMANASNQLKYLSSHQPEQCTILVPHYLERCLRTYVSNMGDFTRNLDGGRLQHDGIVKLMGIGIHPSPENSITLYHRDNAVRNDRELIITIPM